MSADGTAIDAKTQALSWLVSQLRWEHALEELREDGAHAEPVRRAA